MLNFRHHIKTTTLGIYKVLTHLFKPAVTLEYPEKRSSLSKHFRGVHALKNCHACGKCKKVCPVDAIIINKDETSFRYFINLGKCIFCGNCQYYCPFKAISMTTIHELATEDKTNLLKEVKND